MTDKAYRVMVCGSQQWPSHPADVERMEIELDYHFRIAVDQGWRFVVVHGGARGADSHAAAICQRRGWVSRAFLPDKTVPSPQRFHQRNDRMLAERPDQILAFWDGKSPGTLSVKRKAKQLNLRCATILTRQAAAAGLSA